MTHREASVDGGRSKKRATALPARSLLRPALIRGAIAERWDEAGLHLSHVSIENFRLFGSGKKKLELGLSRGLTLLVGPNDGGKSLIVDAIRLVCGTTSRDAVRVAPEEFHDDGSGAALTMTIRCQIDFDSAEEAATYFEYLTPRNPLPSLFMQYTATRGGDEARNAVVAELRTGVLGTGPHPDNVTLRGNAVTYLRALRDAVRELSAGRDSRLSQILSACHAFAGQGESDFDPVTDEAGRVVVPDTLAGVMKLAKRAIKENTAVRKTIDRLKDAYSSTSRILCSTENRRRRWTLVITSIFRLRHKRNHRRMLMSPCYTACPVEMEAAPRGC